MKTCTDISFPPTWPARPPAPAGGRGSHGDTPIICPRCQGIDHTKKNYVASSHPLRWSACNGKSCGFHLRGHQVLGKNLGGGDPAGGDMGARLPPDPATDKQRLAWKLPRLFTRDQTRRFFPSRFRCLPICFLEAGRALFRIFFLRTNEMHKPCPFLSRCCLIEADGCLRMLIIAASQGLEHYRMIYNGASQSVVKGSTIENEERELAAGN